MTDNVETKYMNELMEASRRIRALEAQVPGRVYRAIPARALKVAKQQLKKEVFTGQMAAANDKSLLEEDNS